MPVTIHAGCGNPSYTELTDGDAYARNKLPIISAFHSMLYKGLPQRFPTLRAGFIEGAANWLPYILNEVAHRASRDGRTFTSDMLAESRMYVACQTNDDLPYLLEHGTQDNLVIGSELWPLRHVERAGSAQIAQDQRTAGAAHRRQDPLGQPSAPLRHRVK